MDIRAYKSLESLVPIDEVRGWSESDVPLERRGVSLAWLVGFVNDLQVESEAPRLEAARQAQQALYSNRAADRGQHDGPYQNVPDVPPPSLMNIHRFVELFVKPLTEQIRAPLYARIPSEHLGQPNVFVSHAWNALLVGPDEQRIGTIDALAHPLSVTRPAYIWIDFICYNQHLFESIAPDMERVVGEIGRIAFVGTPVPLLNRSWCLWELLCSERVAADPEMYVHAGFRNDKILSVNALSRSFTGVESSTSSSAKDQADIFQQFLKYFGSFESANKHIDALIRDKLSGDWFELQEPGTDLQFRPYPWVHDRGTDDAGKAAGSEKWRSFDPYYSPLLRNSVLLDSDVRVFDLLIGAGLHVPNLNCNKATVSYDLDNLTEQVIQALADVMTGDIVKIKRALYEGLSVNTIFKGVHLLTDLVVSGHLEAIKTLLDAGADPDGTGSRVRPLHAAASFGRLDVIRLLVEQGAMVDAVGPGGQTALHLASHEGQIEVVEQLLRLGANLHAVTSEDRLTPLHVAAIGGHTDVAAMLIARGAAVSAKASKGATPLVYALIYSHGKTADLLMNHSEEADLRELANTLAKQGEQPGAEEVK